MILNAEGGKERLPVEHHLVVEVLQRGMRLQVVV
jgi:hypothetical protein